jgi:hypothetical protein
VAVVVMNSDQPAWADQHILVVQVLRDILTVEILLIIIKDILPQAQAALLVIFQGIAALTVDRESLLYTNTIKRYQCHLIIKL